MGATINIVLIITLVCITWQDFKTRQITVLLFPLVTLLVMVLSLEQLTLVDMGTNFLANVSFLALQLVFVFYYVKMRFGKRTWFLRDYLGWGDILILLCTCFVFSLAGFVLYVISVSLLSIVLTVGYRYIALKKMETIPFAGVAALLFAVAWLTGLNRAEEWVSKLLAVN